MLSFHRTEEGIYVAKTDQFNYRIFKSENYKTQWVLQIWNTVNIAGLLISGELIDVDYSESKKMAVTVANAYAENTLSTEKPYLTRLTRAINAAYA